jgi:hypothetical protein
MMKWSDRQLAGRLLAVCLIFVILMTGCGIGPSAATSTQAAVAIVPAATATAQPDAGPSPTPVDPADLLKCPSINCYPPNLNDDIKRRCASDTSRSLEDFARLKITMTITEMCAVVGMPDWETGSGLRIFVYDLPDGSRILAGFAGEDQMMYVQQLFPTGRSAKILMR